MKSYNKTHYPFSFSAPDSLESLANVKSIFCPICGHQSDIDPFDEHLRRGSGKCKNCGSWNRQRLLALYLMEGIRRLTGVHVENLSSDTLPKGLQIFSAEWYGATHKALKRLDGYHWSRYSGSNYKSGDTGQTHQNPARYF